MSEHPDPRPAPADRPAHEHAPAVDAATGRTPGERGTDEGGAGGHDPGGRDAAALDAPDAALAAAVADDEHAPFDLAGLAEETGAGRPLLEALDRAGLLVPHHVEADGTARYSAADAAAVRAGLALLDAGLPLGELLDLARRTDAAVSEVADHAVEAFLRFVRDPVRGTSDSDDEAAARLVTAYREMLPATERLVAHHLRRRLLATAAERVLEAPERPGADDDPGGGAQP